MFVSAIYKLRLHGFRIHTFLNFFSLSSVLLQCLASLQLVVFPKILFRFPWFLIEQIYAIFCQNTSVFPSSLMLYFSRSWWTSYTHDTCVVLFSWTVRILFAILLGSVLLIVIITIILSTGKLCSEFLLLGNSYKICQKS